MSAPEKQEQGRAHRRQRPSHPSVREQRFASLMRTIVAAGTVARPHGEIDTVDAFMGRVRIEAARVQHRARRAARTRAKAARKANR